MWSPSRILGNFLIYRELEKRQQKRKRSSVVIHEDEVLNGDETTANSHSNGGVGAGMSGGGPVRTARRRSSSSSTQDDAVRNHRQLMGSLSEAYDSKPDGLVKKTMSVVVNNVSLHLVSYYHPDDVVNACLRTPSSVPELANLEISPDLLIRQNFRIPPMVEPDNMFYSSPGTSSYGKPSKYPLTKFLSYLSKILVYKRCSRVASRCIPISNITKIDQPIVVTWILPWPLQPQLSCLFTHRIIHNTRLSLSVPTTRIPTRRSQPCSMYLTILRLGRPLSLPRPLRRNPPRG